MADWRDYDSDVYTADRPGPVPGVPAWIDAESGAPVGARASVGSLDSVQDRAATLRLHTGGDVVTLQDLAALMNARRPELGFVPEPDMADELVFFNPETSRWTLYNAPGLDTGDVFSVAREAVQTVAGTGAAVIGGLAGGTPGAIAGAGVGEAAGGALFDQYLNDAGIRIDTRTAGERIGAAATDVMLGSVGEGIGRGIGRLFGRPGVPGRSALLRDVLPESSPGFVRSGISAGIATQSPFIRSLEQGLSRLPGGGVLVESYQRATEELGQRVQEMALRYGAATTPEAAGRSLQTGAETYMTGVRSQVDAINQQVFSLVPTDTSIPMTASMATTDQIARDLPNLPETQKFLQSGMLAGLRNDLAANGELTIQEAQVLRQRIREMVGPAWVSPTRTPEQAQLMMLYDAIDQDIGRGLMTNSPEAFQLWQRQKEIWKRTQDEVRSFLGRYLKADERGTTYANLFTGLVGNEARQTGERLRELRRVIETGQTSSQFINQLSPQTRADLWGDVGSALLMDMGREVPSASNAIERAFDPNTFLKNWRALSDDAKDAIFGGSNQVIRQNLDRIVEAASLIGDRSYRNWSNTAHTLQATRLAMGLVSAGGGLASGDIGTALAGAGAVVGTATLSKLLTTRAGTGFLAAISSAGSIPELSGALGRIGMHAAEAEDWGTLMAMEEFAAAVASNLLLVGAEAPTTAERLRGPDILPEAMQ